MINIDIKIEEEEINYIENELYETFLSFYHFSLDLIEKIDSSNNYLKFALVNIQISLELFLKYYFVKKGEINSIIVTRKGTDVKYKDFSDVLNYFFKYNKWTYGKKKELRKILEVRNDIVHNGLNGGWNETLALYLIKCVFFIQGTMRENFGNTLIQQQYRPHILSRNNIWRKGVEEFVEKLSDDTGCQVFECLDCGAHTLISNEIFSFEDVGYFSGDQLQCLCCMQYIDLELECCLIDCYSCGEESSYIINKMNEQNNRLYIGKCLECGVDTWVRRCSNCDCFYHPTDVDEYRRGSSYYCSFDCYKIDE